jgi:hypothetical protein
LIVSVGTGGGSLISVPCRSFARAVFLLLRSFFQSACADVHFRFDSSVRAAGHRLLTSPFGFSLQFFVWLLARTVFQSWDSGSPCCWSASSGFSSLVPLPLFEGVPDPC